MEKTLKGFKTNKQKLLAFGGKLYYSGDLPNITAFRKIFPEFKSNDKAYEFLLQEYNDR